MDYQWSDIKRGSGSFGTVYVGYLATGEKVAVKVCHQNTPSDVWEAEIAVLSKCAEEPSIPNIVQIRSYRAGSIALELADTTLDDMIKNSVMNVRGLSQAIIGDLMLDLTVAVTSLQTKQIAHRDIKPGNILAFRKDNRKSKYLFKLGDMGTSTVRNSNETLVGTYPLLAPPFSEALAKGVTPFSKVESKMTGFTIDAWSVGCTIFYASTSLYPFRVEGKINTHEAVKHIEQGDISVVKVGGKIQHSKTLPHHRFDKLYAFAVSRYIRHCLDVYLTPLTDADASKSLMRMIGKMQNMVEMKFVGLKNRRFFKYADLSDEQYLTDCPSFKELSETKDLSSIKFLSENGVIEGENIKKLSTLPSETVHFVLTDYEPLNDPRTSPHKEFEILLTNKKQCASWFNFCSKEFHECQQELEFMRESIKAIERIEKRAISDGMMMYQCSENTISIIETFKYVCASALFARNETETLQFFGCSNLYQNPLKGQIETMKRYISDLNKAQLDFDEYKQFLENLDINIDELNEYLLLPSTPSPNSYSSNTTYTQKLIRTLCDSMRSIYEQSAKLQKQLKEHAKSCVIIFNHIAEIKKTHQELIKLVDEHQGKVKTKLDQIHGEIAVLSKTKPVDVEVLKGLNDIAERLKDLVVQQ
ncbi:unnamed protein product [Auanema sp. JU1783]|nr:unnamed protein product [Auanema sp. JU1783]